MQPAESAPFVRGSSEMLNQPGQSPSVAAVDSFFPDGSVNIEEYEECSYFRAGNEYVICLEISPRSTL